MGKFNFDSAVQDLEVPILSNNEYLRRMLAILNDQYVAAGSSTNGAQRVEIVDPTTGLTGITRVGYNLKFASTTFTRPNDTTQYAIGDAIAPAVGGTVPFSINLTTAGVVAGQSIEIRKLAITSSVKGATLPLINAYLRSATFVTTVDNSPLDIDDATMQGGGSWINCDQQNFTASNSRVSKQNTNTPMIISSAGIPTMYGALQAANAYTPAANEVFGVLVWFALL